MNAISVQLPLSLHKATKELAKKEHISVNQFITLAISEKLSVLGTIDFLQSRAKKGNRQKFLKVLRSAPVVEPVECDKF